MMTGKTIMVPSSAQQTAPLSEEGVQPGRPEAPVQITPQILPYAFAKRHGVLIGQIENDVVNILHYEAPDPVVLAEISRITHRNISLSLTPKDQFTAMLAQTNQLPSNVLSLLG